MIVWSLNQNNFCNQVFKFFVKPLQSSSDKAINKSLDFRTMSAVSLKSLFYFIYIFYSSHSFRSDGVKFEFDFGFLFITRWSSFASGLSLWWSNWFCFSLRSQIKSMYRRAFQILSSIWQISVDYDFINSQKNHSLINLQYHFGLD